ncbi:MAG: CDP-alcohol phosphatidyltransferase [Chitinophagaceae bacterium]|nr:MAG: CDP-alcohol phosphatidyltransferase [Chitinophagaceae bacterium]
MKQIPNLFTLLNLFLGCIAIVFMIQNGITIYAVNGTSQLIDMPEQIWMASLFIGIAAVVDFLDGFVARLFKASSEMGKQLDSLADVVSFGVAPGMILYQFLRLSIAREANGIDASIAWLVPAFIVPCAAAWRLARFNLDTTSQSNFRGVPVPAVGLLVASFPLIYWSVSTQEARELLLSKWLIYGVIAVVSGLMVSTLPMLGFKFKNLGVADNLPRYIVIGVAVIGAIFLQWLAVPLVFLAYVLISLLFKNKIA